MLKKIVSYLKPKVEWVLCTILFPLIFGAVMTVISIVVKAVLSWYGVI